MQSPIHIYPISEKAITVQFDYETSQKSLKQVMAFQEGLSENLFDGFIEAVPTYSAVTVYYDPIKVMQSKRVGDSPSKKVTSHLKTIQPKTKIEVSERWMTIPVCYELEFGLDLNELVEGLKLSIEEIIQLHSETTYTVFMVGFTPGFAYMGITHPALECKRKQTPRVRIPPGSVAIALNQTGIYPLGTPGGWQIIGRTPLKLFSVLSNPPALLRQGDRVRFERISKEEFNEMKNL